MKESAKQQGRRLVRPLVSLLIATKASPTFVTLLALPLSIGAALAFAWGKFVLAGVFMALGGLCDTLDGELSRRTGTTTPLGAFLDSTVDRISESLVFMGLYWYYHETWYGLLPILAMVLSLLVSYVRARAEGVGRECKVGFFERPIRVIVLLAGAFIAGRTWMPVVLGLIALGSALTVVQRMVYVLKQKAPNS
jgi:CDP-diacylglycerol--glycerol-3-phosphate 3-phosphatidyltransferase